MDIRQPLEREPTEKLAFAFLQAIQAHYRARPTSRATVLEILNALAAVSGEMVSGLDEEALEFFLEAFHQNTMGAIKTRDAAKQHGGH